MIQMLTGILEPSGGSIEVAGLALVMILISRLLWMKAAKRLAINGVGEGMKAPNLRHSVFIS